MEGRSSLALLAGAVAAAVAAAAAFFLRAPPPPSFSRAKVVLFGDSITQHSFEPGGWGATIADFFSRRCDVFNRGFGGYNTRWARHVLPKLFPEGEDAPHFLVTCWFGANDAAAESEKPHVPLAEYEDNLRHIVQHLKRVSSHVVVLTPPPVHGPTRLAFQKLKYGARASGVLERTTERAGQYAATAARVAAEQGVPCLDVHKLMLAEGESNWPALVGEGSKSGDGLHLVEAGQKFVGKALVALLIDALGLPRRLSPEEATPQERILVEVPRLPIELPPGARLSPDGYAAQIEEHEKRATGRTVL